MATKGAHAAPWTRTRPAIDPRIKERKTNVARVARRRRLRLLVVALLVVVVVVGGLLILHSPVFAARNVVVTGANETPEAAILTASGLVAHPPLIDVNPAAAERAIERLPWVDSATVSRHWPSGVHITVTEHVAIGQVTLAHHEVALIDTKGRVLTDERQGHAGLITLHGIAPVPAPGGALRSQNHAIVTLADAVPVSLASKVAFVGTDAKLGLVLSLRDGPIVIFANDNDLRQKMVSLATMLAPSSKVSLSGILTIDLRVPSSPLLTR